MVYTHGVVACGNRLGGERRIPPLPGCSSRGNTVPASDFHSRKEATQAPTLFLGDGINDAPAMQAATVAVAFGVQSDITSEAADAVILETSLGQVDELIHVARRMRRIELQSAVGGMALSILGMIAAAFGYLPPIGGAIAQEIIDLAAVLNAVRVALPTHSLTDF